MAIQGLRSTADFVADQRPKNWKEGYLYNEPNGMAPLTALTSVMKSRSVDDPEFHWWEKQRQARRFPLTANLTTSNTSVTISGTPDARMLKDGDLLVVEQTNEVIRVNGDPSAAGTLNVIRGFSGSVATAVTYNGAGVNPNLFYIGSAYEEGSLAPTSVRYDPTQSYNYTQIFRDTLAHTRTAMKTKLRTPDDVKEAKKDCMEYHMQGIERAYWFGKRIETTLNGEPLRTMGGVFSFIDSNNIYDVASDYSSGLTMSGLENYMEQIFRFGSSEKMVFLGNKALLVLNQVVRRNSTFEIQSGIKEYGMNVSRLISPFGELVLKTHPMFNQAPGGTTGGTAFNGYNGYAAVLDMAQLKYVYLDGSDTQYEPDLTPKGLDGKKSGYLTECSLEFGLPTCHALLKGLNKAAVDS